MSDKGTESAQILPLVELHRRLGARWCEVDGFQLPAAYPAMETSDAEQADAIEAEYRALRENCGLFDRSWAARLEMRGEDRQRFLNGLVTCDLSSLGAGQGTYGFFTDAQGRILSDVAILALEDRFWLELPPGRGAAIRSHLEKYVVADRVEVSVLERVVSITLAGPRVEVIVEQLLNPVQPLPAPPWGHAPATILGQQVRLARTARHGLPAFNLWLESVEPAQLVTSILEVARGGGLRPVGYEALERVRIEEGLPRFGRDFDAENFPQETELEEAVSFEKGCYLGQEVVARIHFRGQVNRCLRRVKLPRNAVTEIGSALHHAGRKVGVVTSIAYSPRHDAPLGLAMIHRRGAEPGTRLTLEGGAEAEVLAARP